jgi:hypothetical protein
LGARFTQVIASSSEPQFQIQKLEISLDGLNGPIRTRRSFQRRSRERL